MRRFNSIGSSLGSSSSRYRVRLARAGAARRMTHLDQIKTLRRCVQNAGFEGGVKAAFGPAISMGYESDAEYIDLKFTGPVSLTRVKEKLAACLPEGFKLVGVKRIPTFFPSIEAVANVVEYEIAGPFPEDAQARLDAIAGMDVLPIMKFKKGVPEWVDAKEQILRLERAADGNAVVVMRFGPKRSIKPERLLSAWLDLDEEWIETAFRFRRREILCESPSGKLTAP